MGVRSLAIVHVTPSRGNTGAHRMNRLMYDLLGRHFNVKEYAFARGGTKQSALYYPFYPLARPLAEGLMRRNDVVFTEWSGYFPVPGDLTYMGPPTPPEGRTVPLRQLMGVGPRPARGFWPPPFEWLYYNPIVRPLFDRAAMNALDRIGTILATGRTTQRQILEDFGRESRVVYPAIPAPELAALVAMRSRPRSRRVLVISRIVPVKHLEDVLAIADRLPEVSFTVIGYLPAHGRAYLEQLRRRNRAGNVKFLPNLDEASKREYLSRSKVVVNPSRNDTLVIALLEAMAAGLAPVAHASGGPLEYLEPHQLYRTIDEA
ncbi:MAG: glycosyltransferase, partial [Thermoplasmata archaeon]|nr:glycosyltransferase [Thermoplasmata archaeon]